LFQSDALYTEINHVLGKFGTPFLALFEVTPTKLLLIGGRNANITRHWIIILSKTRPTKRISLKDLLSSI